MKLKNLISLNILSFCAYLNLFLCFYVFFIEGSLANNHHKELYITIEKLSEVLSVFLLIGYLLIIAAVIEYFKKKKHKENNDNSSEKTVFEKISCVSHSLLFVFSMIYETLFLIFYTALYIFVLF